MASLIVDDKYENRRLLYDKVINYMCGGKRVVVKKYRNFILNYENSISIFGMDVKTVFYFCESLPSSINVLKNP